MHSDHTNSEAHVHCLNGGTTLTPAQIAAPDLLEALMEIHDYITHHPMAHSMFKPGGSGHRMIYETIPAVIKKARPQ